MPQSSDEPAVAARLRLDLLGLQGERMLSLAEAAELTGLHQDTLRRRHADKIHVLSPRRRGMRLRDVLAIGNAEAR
jgi:hypothetical protein